MKKIYFITLLFALTGLSKSVNAQPPSWLWAKSAGGNSYEYGFSCATDASGNIIVAGSFQSPTITFGTTTLTNEGGSDFFIVKYNPSGNVLWAKSAGGWSFDGGYSCATDASGNIIATGSFNSDSITFGTIVLHGTASPDFFVVKYDPNGNALWAKSAGAASWTDMGSGCTTDANGNVIVTGSFQSPTITFGTTVLTATAGSVDMFIVKYDPNGNVLWAESAGGIYMDEPNSCSTDASGNIIATGDFTSPAITFGTTTLTNAGSKDMFIVKYDPNGNVLWAKSAGGTLDETGTSCATDASGNIIATGSFYGSTVTFGPTVLTNAGYAEIFIVKYDPSGNELWAKSAAGGTSYAGGCTTDGSGNIIASGSYFSPAITFDSDVLNNTDISGNTGDIFIVKYNTSGNVVWAKSVGGIGNFDDASYGCATNANGNIFITGTYNNHTIQFESTALTNAGNYDMYVAKLASLPVGINENQEQQGLNIFPNPGDGQIEITSSDNLGEIKIINALGQIIYQAKPYANRFSLQLDETGIYFIQIITDKEIISKKIIVRK